MNIIDVEKMYDKHDINMFLTILDSIVRSSDKGYGRINGEVFSIEITLIDEEEMED